MAEDSAHSGDGGHFVPQVFSALVVERFGKSGVTSRIVEDYKVDDLPADGMTVKVSHAGLTFHDAMVVQGCSGAVRDYPIVPGTDLAGTVLCVDEDAEQAGFRVGDRIVATGGELGQSRSGGFSQIARVPAKLAWKLPTTMDNMKAAQLGTAAMTAALACMEIERGDLAASLTLSSTCHQAGRRSISDNSKIPEEKEQLNYDDVEGSGEQEGDASSNRRSQVNEMGKKIKKKNKKTKKKKYRGSVLVSGASGSVGSFVTCLLVARGYRVVAVTRHLEKQNRLYRFGAHSTIILEDFLAECSEDGDLGIETYVGVVDMLGEGFTNACLPRLSRGGVCVSLGALCGPIASIPMAPFVRRGVRLVGVDSRYVSHALRCAAWEQLAKYVPWDLLEAEKDSFTTATLAQIQPLSGRKLSSGAAPVSTIIVLPK